VDATVALSMALKMAPVCGLGKARFVGAAAELWDHLSQDMHFAYYKADASSAVLAAVEGRLEASIPLPGVNWRALEPPPWT
jgi:hypothetical protein